MSYSIIIPIYNEDKTINLLINQLKPFSDEGNEVIIVNDGSDDNTSSILSKYDFIKIINLKKNFGKGVAIRTGLYFSKNEKIIIFDGDLELKTDEISKLMILDKEKKNRTVFGIRSKFFNPFFSSHDWGNFIFTTFFNLINITNYKDILCCAKSFYKRDIFINKLQSVGFDIDVELASMITYQNKRKNIKQQLLKYSRRSTKAGKKLKISDGWTILKRIIVVSKNR